MARRFRFVAAAWFGCAPTAAGLEVVSRGQRNIYDVAVDPYLNLFTRDNTNDGDGWDVRLSHVVPTGHLGYPSLFKNFASEIVAPLADYGGGSPTGSLYLQEPGFPEPYGDALYTSEWGREGIFRHPLEPSGAGFKAGQEPFVMLPRPTDLDVDGQGRLYISSWRGASFTYVGPKVGYVIRVTRNRRVTGTRSEFDRMPAMRKLVGYLSSPSQVIRLAAQRAIVAAGQWQRARHETGRTGKVARTAGDAGRGDLHARALAGPRIDRAARQVDGRRPGARIRPARLADRKEDAVRIPVKPFVAGVGDANPRVRLQAVVGLGRLGKVEAAPAIVARLGDGDPLVAHVAVKALVALDASSACLAALGPATPNLAPARRAALQAML